MKARLARVALVKVSAATLSASLALAGCAGRAPCVGGRPECEGRPGDPVAVARVLSGPLLPPASLIARHTWFAVRGSGEQRWERWEIWYKDASETSWGYVARNAQGPWDWNGAPGPILIHGELRGPQAAAFIECLRDASPRYEHRDFYVFWPGPNSNTYVDAMLSRCGFPVDLPPTAVGKDWRGVVGLSPTTRGTGAQIETPFAGVKIGLAEGIEIHLLTLTFGIDFWPPALKVPIGTGRIGFDDD
jgi:hypothetical protein